MKGMETMWRSLWVFAGLLIARYVYRRKALVLDPVARMRRAGL